MIVYQLRCQNAHEFEGWFRDSSAWETQSKHGDVQCPVCGNTDISKAIMAPNISTTKSRNSNTDERRAESRAKELAEQILEAVGKIQRHVEKTCDDVGDKFAEEARRIEYGEAKVRGIYGSATDDEAAELDEEGIDFYRLPAIRRDS